jgi:hypothetical protein
MEPTMTEMKPQAIDNVIILAVLDAIIEPTSAMLREAERIWVPDLDDFVDEQLARLIWQEMIRAKRHELRKRSPLR